MGYNTKFEGRFLLSRGLTVPEFSYLKAFNNTRRMMRNQVVAEKLRDPERTAVNLPIGPQGAYFVGASENDSSIIDYNSPPSGQPNLWCQWEPSADGLGIEYDGGESFYDYCEWLNYLIQHFLRPWDIEVSGQILWDGEETGDVGHLVIENGVCVEKPIKFREFT